MADRRAAVSVVVLTRGDRDEALTRALRSVRRQDVAAETVVVWNGVEPRDLGEDLVDVSVPLDHNAGIPAGRNAGADASSADVLFFLDDDAWIEDEFVVSEALRLFAQDPLLGVVSCRILDEDGRTARRHVPRLGGDTAERSGPVTSFLGGVSFARTTAFRSVGGLPGPYFYALEETDLAWRLIDEGWHVWYAADLHVRHPRSDPSRHADSARHTARNRVWLAHRLLPAPVAALYVLDWTIATIGRAVLGRSFTTVVAVARGTREGWSSRIGPRSPIGWRTVWRLTRLGRPPVI